MKLTLKSNPRNGKLSIGNAIQAELNGVPLTHLKRLELVVDKREVPCATITIGLSDIEVDAEVLAILQAHLPAKPTTS